MNFKIKAMWVDTFSLVKTDKKTDNNQNHKMILGMEMDYNTTDKKSIRLRLGLNFHRSESFIFEADQHIIVEFDEEISSEEAEEIIRGKNAPGLFYPYARAFAISTLTLAGYKNINLPVMYFVDE